MVRKVRGLINRGTKGRGRIVIKNVPIVNMGLRLKRQPDKGTCEAIANASSEYISVAGGPRFRKGKPVDAEGIQRSFGERVRELRQLKDISQEALALVCGLDRAYIGGVERGERNISLVNIYKVARGLNVHAKELMP